VVGGGGEGRRVLKSECQMKESGEETEWLQKLNMSGCTLE
jgi:hypothetical protein